MKRETLRHPKTIHLAALLDVDRPTALGYLTLLWDYTGEVAIQGNIGKWPNDVIAAACDWPRGADEFIDALVAARWLDISKTHRLLIHDWADHRERWVAKKLERSKLVIIAPTRTCDAVDQRSDDGRPIASLSNPIQSNPNLSNPIQSEPNTLSSGDDVATSTDQQQFLEAWAKTPGVTVCRKFTDKRRAAFEQRIRDPSWDWRAALAKFPLKLAEGKKWTTIDWFLKPDTVVKILEDTYDWSTSDGRNKRYDSAIHTPGGPKGSF